MPALSHIVGNMAWVETTLEGLHNREGVNIMQPRCGSAFEAPLPHEDERGDAPLAYRGAVELWMLSAHRRYGISRAERVRCPGQFDDTGGSPHT